MKLSNFLNILFSLSVIALIGCSNNSKRDSEEESKLPKKPNILFIYLDDMGYGDLQCYNSKSLIPTPNIDRLAKEGMRFTDAHSAAAICGPSRYGLLTGCYPWRRGKGGVGNGKKFRDVFIEEGRQTIASMLKNNGYNTAQMGKWGLRHNYSAAVKTGMKPGTKDAYDFPNKKLMGSQLFGFDYAFTQTYLFPVPGIDTIPGMDIISDAKMVFENSLPQDPTLKIKNPYDLLPESAENAIEYIEAYAGKKENPKFGLDRDKPFFLYWDPVGPHTPYTPLPEFRGKSKVGDYGDYVFEIDHYIGKMMDKLEELELADNTIVIFSSDNGPDKFTYSRVQNFKHYSMGEWRGVKRDAWEGGNRIPFIIKWPGKVKPTTVNDTQFCLIDMMATFTELVGAKLADNAGEDSFSILSLLQTDHSKFSRPPIIYHNTKGKMGIRIDNWVYIDAPSGAVDQDPDWFKKERGVITHNEKVELFNLSEDPQQLKNLALKNQEKVKELKQKLDEMIEKGRSR